MVSCEYLFWSWHESIFKICCLKSGFYQWQDLCFFYSFWICWKMANFEGLWWPNHLTYIDLWGIKWKIISISFIWYLVSQFLTTGTGTERLQEKVAWSCEPQKVDISPVLSYSTPDPSRGKRAKSTNIYTWNFFQKHMHFSGKRRSLFHKLSKQTPKSLFSLATP